MSVQQVADLISLATNPCRLKLSRQGVPSANRKDPPIRPASVDGDSFFQQQQHQTPMKSLLMVGIIVFL